ncbi:MAG: hypothetical protein GY757_15495 [bacterium]|nr:hypothetical protein [bacterium]
MRRKTYFIITAILFTFFLQQGYSQDVILDDVILGRNFVVDNDGNIYIDRGSYTIIKYSPEGKRILRFGRKGEGPGDIKRLGCFAINPVDSNLYITEFLGGNRWISKFSKNGTFIGLWNFEFEWDKWEGLSFITFDSKGNTYFEATKYEPRRHKSFSIGKSVRHIFKYSPSGKKIKKVYRFEADFYADKGGKGNITIPFGNYLYWIVYKDYIIVRENCSTFISMFDLDGILVKKIVLPFKQEKVTSADIDEWENKLKSNPGLKKSIAAGIMDLKFWKKSLPFPKTKPMSGSQLLVDSSGYLFSKKFSPRGNRTNTWAKIDLKTWKITVVNGPPGRRLHCIEGQYFYYSQDHYETAIKTNKGF